MSNSTDKYALDPLLHKSLTLRSKGARKEALAALKPHFNIAQKIPAGAGVIATLYWELQDHKNAAKWFRIATALSPKSETASLGLFHSLWELNRSKQAFTEIRRFLAISKSTEYSKILRELQTNVTVPKKSVSPSKSKPLSVLTMEDRYTFIDAEHAALDWRNDHLLTPVESLELQHA